MRRFAPVGICSLIAARLAEMGNVIEVLTMLGKFIGTVLTGLSIHSFIVVPLIFYVVSRRNPYKYMYRMMDAMVYLFGVDSRYDKTGMNKLWTGKGP